MGRGVIWVNFTRTHISFCRQIEFFKNLSDFAKVKEINPDSTCLLYSIAGEEKRRWADGIVYKDFDNQHDGIAKIIIHVVSHPETTLDELKKEFPETTY